MSASNSSRRIAIIGFGEVGRIFAEALLASGRHDVATYDILFDDPARRAEGLERARDSKIEACATAAEAARGARVVISAVTAPAARAVAVEAARYMGPGQIFLDINSVSPETKRGNAAAVERSGAAYVEAAVMAPVAPYGLAVPILLGGASAKAAADLLNPAGMKLEVGVEAIGHASAIKMCRSIMIKGLEAITLECFMTAWRYGVEDVIVRSLDKSYPGMNWETQAGYLISRVAQHGRRRAAEMREVADTVREIGLEPVMASATALRQDWLADEADAQPEIRRAPEADWRKTLDLVAAHALVRPKAAE